MNKKALSLIEIMLVIAAIAILATTSAVFSKSRKIQANHAAAENHLKIIYAAMNTYASFNNGKFPTSASGSSSGKTTDVFVRLTERVSSGTFGSFPYLSDKYSVKDVDTAIGTNGYVFTYNGSTPIAMGGTNNDETEFTFTADPLTCHETGEYVFSISSRTNERIFRQNCVVSSGGGCCPTAFKYTGDKFEILADIIPSSIIGHLQIPGMPRIQNDPDEYIKIENITPNKDGLLEFKILQSFPEVVYFDQIKLVAIDHAKYFDILPNEYITITKPFPEFKIYRIKNLITPVKAIDKGGNDILSFIKNRDNIYMPIKKTRLRGFTEPYSLILDFGDLSSAKQIQLLANGYTKYPKLTTAKDILKSGRMKPILPVIEVPDKDGNWIPIRDKDTKNPIMLVLGDYITKVITIDLTDAFPTNDYRIRVSSDMEMYFDYFAINTFSDYQTPITINDLNTNKAILDFKGPLKLTLINEVPYFDYYGQRNTNIPKYVPKGNYTRYGEITELLADNDDKFAILTTGDEIDLVFDINSLPPVQAEYKRDFLLYVYGYHKIYNPTDHICNKVEPLPFKAMSDYPYPKTENYPNDKDHQDYIKNYNTRQVK